MCIFGGGTTIGCANLDGKGVTETFVRGLVNPCGLGVDARHISWANWGGVSNTIGRANLDGSAVSQRFVTGAKAPCGVVTGP